MSELAQQALWYLNPVVGATGLSPAVDKALRRAVKHLNAAMGRSSGAEQQQSYASAIAHLMRLSLASGGPEDAAAIAAGTQALEVLKNVPADWPAKPAAAEPSNPAADEPAKPAFAKPAKPPFAKSAQPAVVPHVKRGAVDESATPAAGVDPALAGGTRVLPTLQPAPLPLDVRAPEMVAPPLSDEVLPPTKPGVVRAPRFALPPPSPVSPTEPTEDIGSAVIAERLQWLTDAWTAFVKRHDARLLRWLIDTQDLPLIEAFVEREGHPDAAETPDLFLVFESPFEAVQHGLTLTAELTQAWIEDGAALAEAGVDITWTAIPAREGQSDVETFLANLKPLAEAAGDDDGVLAVWLRPERVADVEGYLLWLQRLAQKAPANVRFMIVDDAQVPSGSPLARVEPKLVVSEQPEVDLPAAMADIAEQAASTGDPRVGALRLLLVRMGQAGKEQRHDDADQFAVQALGIAKNAGWLDQIVVVLFMQGSLRLNAGRNVEAARSFMAAEEAAAAAEQAGSPTAKQTRLQSRLLTGTALLMAGAFARAAMVFEQTVPVAKDADDQRSELDAWRLGSYGHEQAGALDEAWRCALEGLKVAKAMDEATRSSSTARHLAQAIDRLTRHRSLNEYEAPLRRELTSIFGDGWQGEA